VTERVQYQHAPGLRGGGLHREQKKENYAPPNFVRPCHSGKGRHCKTQQYKFTTNSLGKPGFGPPYNPSMLFVTVVTSRGKHFVSKINTTAIPMIFRRIDRLSMF
jgi:hypothetical protein